jgi:hypothetical protein
MDIPTPQEIEPKRSHRLVIILLVIIIALLVFLRFSPWCMTSAGRTGWNTWVRVYPNLVCALDLHGEEVSAEELEERLSSLTNVTELNLSAMKLQSVPNAISTLKKLEKLNVSHNMIADIPDDIVSVTYLTELDLSSNTITQIPDSLSGLSGLTFLDLSDNEISSAPSFLQNSSASSVVSLGQNPLGPSGQGNDEGQSSQSSAAASSSLPSASSSAISSVRLQDGNNFSNESHTSSTSNTLSSSSDSSVTSSSQVSSVTPEDSSALSSSATSFASLESGVSCTRNFTVNAYSMCIPSFWTVQQTDPLHMNLMDGSVIAAKVECPMEQATYDQWQLTLRSRTFQKDGTKHGADEFSGTSVGSSELGLLLVFMHKNDFNSWFGDNYSDVAASCQIESIRPQQDANIFRLLYLSVQ